jgi:uncharacterized protein
MTLTIRDATPADFAAILALNFESEALLSPLDTGRLVDLAAQAAYHRVLCEGDKVVGFLLALREGTDYQSLNYQWFAQRYDAFVYIDRIAVAASHQGRKLGQRLYEDLFAFARAQSVGIVTCEFYVEPLNAASQRFHSGFGFREVGTQWVAEGTKKVSLQVATA